MTDTDKYEDAKKMVQDAGLIDENDGHPDIHYRKIALLLAEVKRSDELFKDCLAKLEFYVERFGIESLVEMVEGEEE